jgi:hypothetical protein
MVLTLPTVFPHSDELEFVDGHLEQQNEIADQLLGMVARRDGKPLDKSKSAAWQRGWSVMSRSKTAG